MMWKIYLSGEIHTKWRDELKTNAKEASLNVEFLEPESSISPESSLPPSISIYSIIKFLAK